MTIGRVEEVSELVVVDVGAMLTLETVVNVWRVECIDLEEYKGSEDPSLENEQRNDMQYLKITR